MAMKTSAGWGSSPTSPKDAGIVAARKGSSITGDAILKSAPNAVVGYYPATAMMLPSSLVTEEEEAEIKADTEAGAGGTETGTVQG